MSWEFFGCGLLSESQKRNTVTSPVPAKDLPFAVKAIEPHYSTAAAFVVAFSSCSASYPSIQTNYAGPPFRLRYCSASTSNRHHSIAVYHRLDPLHILIHILIRTSPVHLLRTQLHGPVILHRTLILRLRPPMQHRHRRLPHHHHPPRRRAPLVVVETIISGTSGGGAERWPQWPRKEEDVWIWRATGDGGTRKREWLVVREGGGEEEQGGGGGWGE